MGIVRDVTIDNLTQAVQGISSTGISDSTGQAINNTLGTLGKDITLQAIVSALQNLQINVNQTASNVSYNNSISGLTATNVQGAFDEICSDFIITKTYTTSYTVGANTSSSLTANDFNVSTPNGYTPIALSDFASQNVNVVIRGVYGRATGTSAMMAFRNISSSSVTATAYVTIMYIKSLFL